MAIIRVTRELLEYALDLPPSVRIVGVSTELVVDGVECYAMQIEADDNEPPPANDAPLQELAGEGTFALQYQEGEDGLVLVSAVPVT